MDWAGEHILGLDYDRPNGEGGKSYRQSAQEEDARDEASYNKLREKAPCKTAFENSSNVSETTLNLASLAMGGYGVKQLVSSGANYLRMNKSYINANISEAAQNSKILKQAISNIKQNPKGITLPSDIGAFNKYVSDVKGEFDALKNIKNGTKVAGNAKDGSNASVNELVKAGEGISKAGNKQLVNGQYIKNGKPNGRPAAFGKKKLQFEKDVYNDNVDLDGILRDPNTGEVIEWKPGQPRREVVDFGHKSGYSYKEMFNKYKNGDITLNELKDFQTNPDNYRLETPSANRSHKFE